MFAFKMLNDNCFTFYVFILFEVKPATIEYLKFWDQPCQMKQNQIKMITFSM